MELGPVCVIPSISLTHPRTHMPCPNALKFCGLAPSLALPTKPLAPPFNLSFLHFLLWLFDLWPVFVRFSWNRVCFHNHCLTDLGGGIGWFRSLCLSIAIFFWFVLSWGALSSSLAFISLLLFLQSHRTNQSPNKSPTNQTD